MSQARLSVVQMAGMLARDAQFREWVAIVSGQEGIREEHAADWIRFICEIESRRDLAKNTAASLRFENLIRKPFVAWKEQQAETTGNSR